MDLLSCDIRSVRGVGESRAKLLGKLGIHTVEDMLYFFPRYVEDRSQFVPISQLQDGTNACVRAQIYGPVQQRRIKKNLTLYTVVLRDGYDTCTACWFNNRFVMDAFTPGCYYHFYGKVNVKYGKKELSNPTYESDTSNLHMGRVVPIYSLTEKLSQKMIRSIAKECVDAVVGKIEEYLPAKIRANYQLCEINFAISSIHFPASMEDYTTARRRLVFEELLFLQLGLSKMRVSSKNNTAPVIQGSAFLKDFSALLPFQLTGAQKRVIDEIFADMALQTPMARLVQGDVGSGKTMVAFAAMYAVSRCSLQCALMAPTEVLAAQHYETAKRLWQEEEIALLTGSVTAASKRKIRERIQCGLAKVVIGTHALIEGDIVFDNLALVVTDEQHRFGVKQRSALALKGLSPHVLVMSATPIPRTLALILYGDLDISIVDELPPGRTPVATYAVGETMRQRIYRFIEKHVKAGRQAFIVCPLVEESEKLDLNAATQLCRRLQEDVFPHYQVELLHGKMRPAQKNDIMQRFSAGKIQILVSTTVIEVGINVPNATIMVVENAERFGLSQLHQIRGRVGRGSEKSYCILFNGSDSPQSKARMDIMTATSDGFEIAKKDLELRGPGDFLGTRQHGLPNLKIADIAADMPLLKEAQAAAKAILQADPQLKSPRLAAINQRLNKMFSFDQFSSYIS